MTNQAFPEPQLLGQNQGILHWQTMGRLSTQTADFCQFFRTTGQPDDVHIT